MTIDQEIRDAHIRAQHEAAQRGDALKDDFEYKARFEALGEARQAANAQREAAAQGHVGGQVNGEYNGPRGQETKGWHHTNPADDQALRLECVRLAIESKSSYVSSNYEVTDLAQIILDFVTAKPE